VEDSQRGKLLIASPALTDFFERTVVLLLEHNEEGAMGLILNRPSETLVAEAVPSLAELGDDGEVVRVGGPVGQNSVVVLGEFGIPRRRAVRWPGIWAWSTPSTPRRSGG